MQSWNHLLRLVSVAVLLLAPKAAAVPEIARYGHFSCVSCHVSPGGGGLLTTHGRGFAAEKLTTWQMDGEESPGHGLIVADDRWLVGADLRSATYRSAMGDQTLTKSWRMQTDLMAGAHFGNAYVSWVMGTKPQGPMDDPSEHRSLITRGYELRTDWLAEHVILRAGLFIPKFGLMLSDHTALVRSVTGLGPDTEQTQLEAIYQSDAFEVTTALLLHDKRYGREQLTRKGFNGGLSFYLANSYRFNLCLLQTERSQDGVKDESSAMGLSGVLPLSKLWTLLAELDQVSTKTSFMATQRELKKLVSFFNLSYELFRGFLPFVRLEVLRPDLSNSELKTDRYGIGMEWHFRPHWQLQSRVLRTQASNADAKDDVSAILHYYF